MKQSSNTTINTPFFTVFTPTYNRELILHRVYTSLLSQTYKNFEWLIVDDGSVDGTRDLVLKWIREEKMKIRYYYQENMGKHIAINHGVEKAKGELFLIADSDDEFIPETLITFYDKYKEIPESEIQFYAGIWCLTQDVDGEIIGDEFPEDNWDAYFFERIYKYNIKGEKWHVEKLKVLKEFPFPDLKVGKGFVFSESNIWNKIYKKYMARHINYPLRIYYESPDGLMANLDNNPHLEYTIRLGAKEQLNNDINYFFYDISSFIKRGVYYLYYSFKLKISMYKTFSEIKPIRSKLLIIIVFPVFIFYFIKKNISFNG